METLRVKTGRRTQLVDVTEAVGRVVAESGSVGAAQGALPACRGEYGFACQGDFGGASQVIFVERNKLALGRWQGIFFCEFDGPRERQLRVQVVAQNS
jgi:thiamine phosphate synthase YjbQ (UPF0047 family)